MGGILSLDAILLSDGLTVCLHTDRGLTSLHVRRFQAQGARQIAQ